MVPAKLYGCLILPDGLSHLFCQSDIVSIMVQHMAFMVLSI